MLIDGLSLINSCWFEFNAFECINISNISLMEISKIEYTIHRKCKMNGSRPLYTPKTKIHAFLFEQNGLN